MTVPSVPAIHSSTVSRRIGLRTKTPHRPMTTLGIAARSSTRKLSGIGDPARGELGQEDRREESDRRREEEREERTS